MSVFNRRSFGIAALLMLAACGDPEPEQRKAFMAFLQGMIDRPGVHVMNAKADDDKTFGDYTGHYAVILDFNKDMKGLAQPFADRLKQIGADQATQRTIEQMVAHRGDLLIIAEETGKMQTAVRQRLATADTQRAALKQPDDLKKVYDAAYTKLVTAPAQAVVETNAVMADGVKVSLQLVDYIIAHPGKVTVSGSQVRAGDSKTLAEVGELLKAHNAAGVKFEEARRNMHRIVDGG